MVMAKPTLVYGEQLDPEMARRSNANRGFPIPKIESTPSPKTYPPARTKKASFAFCSVATKGILDRM